jgi:hypothetical protein
MIAAGLVVAGVFRVCQFCGTILLPGSLPATGTGGAVVSPLLTGTIPVVNLPMSQFCSTPLLPAGRNLRDQVEGPG